MTEYVANAYADISVTIVDMSWALRIDFSLSGDQTGSVAVRMDDRSIELVDILGLHAIPSTKVPCRVCIAIEDDSARITGIMGHIDNRVWSIEPPTAEKILEVVEE